MPLYEYFCSTCQATFETLRPAAQADQPALCPACRAASAQRILSLVASNVVKSVGESRPTMPMSAGGGCCGGACGCSH
jgi:putative FmdB family regulatory protein